MSKRPSKKSKGQKTTALNNMQANRLALKEAYNCVRDMALITASMATLILDGDEDIARKNIVDNYANFVQTMQAASLTMGGLQQHLHMAEDTVPDFALAIEQLRAYILEEEKSRSWLRRTFTRVWDWVTQPIVGVRNWFRKRHRDRRAAQRRQWRTEGRAHVSRGQPSPTEVSTIEPAGDSVPPTPVDEETS